MNDPKKYHSPLTERYASDEMSYLCSSYFKSLTWRKLWIALARAQKTLGLPITDAQITGLEKGCERIDFKVVEEQEKRVRHDVMAHIFAYGVECPEAKGIIHLGATSCYVTDNGDLIQMREALKLLRNKLVQLLRQLHAFASTHAALPTLSYTHLQPAQPTTVGKRACLWLQDFLSDLHMIEHQMQDLRFLGAKGATGTQASFLALFGGDHHKVKKLEELIAKEMGFTKLYTISGQTYSRKQDIAVMHTLCQLAASAHKFATDLRLLAHLKEIEEPFAEGQIGSSAMPYKRNPMRSERICGLARFLISLNENSLYTEAVQWLERTLDDSANRRLYLPQAFLCADALLNLLCNVTAGLVVHPQVIAHHLHEEIPFLAMEHILMEAAKQGKDRQAIHERLRHHSLHASQAIKDKGLQGDLLEQIANDPAIGLSAQEIKQIASVQNFIGRSIEQTHEFLDGEVQPILQKHKDVKHYAANIAL